MYFVTLQGSVCVHTSGEMDTFITHSAALIAAATCQVWWKSWTTFKVTAQNFWLTFLWTQCMLKTCCLTSQRGHSTSLTTKWWHENECQPITQTAPIINATITFADSLVCGDEIFRRDHRIVRNNHPTAAEQGSVDLLRLAHHCPLTTLI